MKPKAKSGSKMSAVENNANRKEKATPQGGFDLGGSLLKLNEFTLIILGALVVTVLVFFLFFRSPDPGHDKIQPQATVDSGMLQGEVSAINSRLEQRIADIEVSLSRLAASSPEPAASSTSGNIKALTALDHRITRLEQAVTLKLDTLMERLAQMDKELAALKKLPSVSKSAERPPLVETSKPEDSVAAKAPLKKVATTIKKPKHKSTIFHTVKKGETLWSISKAYNTNVGAIRKLNNMTAKDKIYPGNNIIVR